MVETGSGLQDSLIHPVFRVLLTLPWSVVVMALLVLKLIAPDLLSPVDSVTLLQHLVIVFLVFWQPQSSQS